MSDNPFYRLAPFIQEFIYRKGWDNLRAVQVEAARVLFDSSDHLLIMSATASGKTEAAFLPILTDLYANPVDGVGVLYIGPLKALINDQFERLTELLEESRIPVQSWHGDVDAGRKQKYLQNPQGVLQITPESLEAMLILRHADLARIFGNVRYVIIDEIHAFMHTDRGLQILCQLERLRAVQKTPPRRIGLSATLGDPESAAAWLAGNSGIPVQTVDDAGNKRTLELALLRVIIRQADEVPQREKAARSQNEELIAAVEALASDQIAMFEQMYAQTQRKKSIVFTNSRADAERVIGGIREVAQKEDAPDIYHVHHGNISAPLRAAAEAAMQADGQPACTGATMTLELGIDIGRLDQVLQLNATYTVASFVQRLGRAGRREGVASRMLFYHEEDPIDERTHPADHLPWNLLQTIAVIQLYIEEKWIEPGLQPKLPFSLLYHQTLSLLTAYTELSPPELAKRILTLPPFKGITQTHYQTLLRHMLELRHLERAENGKLLVGLEAEKFINNYRFYAVFPDEDGYVVRDGTREIGSIQAAPPPDTVFRLAGFAWKMLEVDESKKVIKVTRAPSRATTAWAGNIGDIHSRIVERVRRVLSETVDYGYLQPAAVTRLAEARKLATELDLRNKIAVSIGGVTTLFLPWKGTRVFTTLALMFRQLGYRVSRSRAPWYMELNGIDSPALITLLLQKLAATPPSLDALAALIPEAELMGNKFDRFIPPEMRREAYGLDRLAYAETVEWLQENFPPPPPSETEPAPETILNEPSPEDEPAPNPIPFPKKPAPKAAPPTDMTDATDIQDKRKNDENL
jgi:ATP-dependent helicase Lhr and Lhr-like helicase